MAALPVEWVLVIYYGRSAHRATYGRLGNTKYTKDYIQLSRKADFLDIVRHLFPVAAGEQGSVPLTYQWPTGATKGALVFKSADRPHLKWETSLGAPKAWKMSLSPSDAVAETIPGDPTHLDFEAAENELELLASRGAGQPYLLAIKLHGEPTTLHLRAYLADPSTAFAWADLSIVPHPIYELATQTSQSSALAWKTFASGGVVPCSQIKSILLRLESSKSPVSSLGEVGTELGRELAAYLRHPGYGLFFDPSKNHDAWIQPPQISEKVARSVDQILALLDVRYPEIFQSDATEGVTEFDPLELEKFQKQIENGKYSVGDATITAKTRGSAQKAFANAVKSNYEYRCAITGIQTSDFLVASRIVPWSEDQSIRLDPSNGICLSLLIDRAFEKGHLLIDDDLTVRINWERVGNDLVLRDELGPYDGKKLRSPKFAPPKPEYLQRRRALILSGR